MTLRRATLLLLVLLPFAGQVAFAERAVVLVTSASSDLESISILSIRKAYLGIPVRQGDAGLTAIRRRDDSLLDEIFLQSVIAMSEKSYERRLLSAALKYAAPRPIEAPSREALVQTLSEQAAGISYMWRSEAEIESRVKIVRVLWQEP